MLVFGKVCDLGRLEAAIHDRRQWVAASRWIEVVAATGSTQRLKGSDAFTFRQKNPFENGPSTKRQADLPNRLDGRKPVLVCDNEPAVALGGPFLRAYRCKQGTRHVEKDRRIRLGIVHEPDEPRGSPGATFQDANLNPVSAYLSIPRRVSR
jgi:hypothetical protein